MISCTTIGKNGRFGNQLFQFASGLGVARKLGFEFKIPADSHRLSQCFNITEFLLNRKDMSFLHRVKEKKIGFDPSLLKISDSTDIYGWFQSEEYFKEIRNELLEIFKFNKDLEEKANHIWKDLDNSKPKVAVHFRRGDYTKNGRLLDFNYYESALALFPDYKFFIFSDDSKWCHSQFLGHDKEIVSAGSDFIDFILMSRCDHHIIANSTFSWWAAWLSQTGGKVVAPKKWFPIKPPNLWSSFPDIYCQNWIVL